MNQDNRKEIVFKEQNVLLDNINFSEVTKYVKFLDECKEVKNTIIPVGNCVKGTILKTYFNKIRFNAAINYSDKDKSENRYIDGLIYINNDEIIFDMHVTRLCIDENKNFTIADIFKSNTHTYNYGGSFFYENNKQK